MILPCSNLPMRIFGSAKRTGAVETPPPVSRRGAAEAYLGQTFLGKYRTRRFLGEGSNAHVFLADTTGGGTVVVKRIKDEDRRVRLERELSDAQAPVIEAVQSAHMFVFDQMQERLAAARKQADMLLEALANPHAPPAN